jgi:hypothetical protein
MGQVGLKLFQNFIEGAAAASSGKAGAGTSGS